MLTVNDVEKLDKCLSKSIKQMNQSIKQVDSGFSKIRKLSLYKNVDTTAVKEKEKELEPLFA